MLEGVGMIPIIKLCCHGQTAVLGFDISERKWPTVGHLSLCVEGPLESLLARIFSHARKHYKLVNYSQRLILRNLNQDLKSKESNTNTNTTALAHTHIHTYPRE